MRGLNLQCMTILTKHNNNEIHQNMSLIGQILCRKTHETRTSYLIVEACSKVMRHYKKVITAFCPIPVRPVGRNELYRTSHHPRRLKRQREAIWCQVTGSVYRGIKPICFYRIKGSDRAGKEKSMHEDLSSKHMGEAS